MPIKVRCSLLLFLLLAGTVAMVYVLIFVLEFSKSPFNCVCAHCACSIMYSPHKSTLTDIYSKGCYTYLLTVTTSERTALIMNVIIKLPRSFLSLSFSHFFLLCSSLPEMSSIVTRVIRTTSRAWSRIY